MKLLLGILSVMVLSFGVRSELPPLALTAGDIGGPTLGGTFGTNAAGAWVLSGSGAGIGLRRDQGHFAWLPVDGNFDVAVQVRSISAPDLFGRAGLMARASLEPDGLFAGVFATPSVAGVLFQARGGIGANGRQSGAAPPNYPYTWLRLQRNGHLFTGATSSDGKVWTHLDSSTMELTSPVYLGLAVTSWSSNQLATAVFADWRAASGAILPASTPARELPGPSTRRTGLVISEVMYHPASRVDGRNLEFIEIFNSQSLFADLSGYRLSGAVDFTFPANTILPAGGFVVVARVPEDVRFVYGLANVVGGYSSGLSNESGVVSLLHRTGAVLLEARYDSQPPWPAAAAGAGHSLVLHRPSYGERNMEAWAASGFKGGSPGRWDSQITDAFSSVVINEIQARFLTAAPDFIELYNASNEAVDVSGAFLSDNPALNRFRIPPGTLLPARGFVAFNETTLGFGLRASGETVYLVAPDGARVIDAVRFASQPLGATFGRSPDGAPAFRYLLQATHGEANSARWESDIVINEIMYHPVSENDDDQYVELFNRGPALVSLAGWQLASGIRFTFPSDAQLPAGGYLVVAKNAARMQTNYPHLTAANCLGNFQGRLSGKGERLTLLRPELLRDGEGTGAAEFGWVTVGEVKYAGGGRWGVWADGGGSSLELTDPHADPTLAANWADSDETGKGEWTTIEHTGVLDLGLLNYGLNQVQILLEGVGECLVDNVEVIGPGGTNMLANGDFEMGITGWTPQGSHRDSTLDTAKGIGGSQCLHVRAESRGDPGANRVRAVIAPGLREGDIVTLRAQVRWLRGFPEFLLRLRGNYLEAQGRLHTSAQLGTPGRANSQITPNAPPAISEVVPSPILPAADQAVVVTARVHDPDGIGSVVLRYRLDPSLDLVEVPMRDDGTGGDALAGDGVYSATIPGQPGNSLAAFHIAAADGSAAGVQGTFPADAPARECLVRFGESQPGGSFGTYRIWMTQAVRNRWSSREKLNNAPLDVTFVYGNQRVIYNAGSLYTGSPFVSGGYSGPTGVLCGYAVRFPADDRFLGIEDMKLDWPVRDSSLQMEQVAYWIADQLDIPSNYRRFVFLYVNGSRRGTLYEDAQQPNSDMVAQYFPGDDSGDLYKIDDWFEFDNGASGFANVDATLQQFTTTGGEKKTARYRWNWRKRAVADSASDYRSLFALVDATRARTPDGFTRNLEALIDIEEFLRVIAFEHIVGNWDSFGYYRGKNMFAYKPQRGKWNLLTWDIDFVLGAGSDSPNTYLFGTIDPTVSQMLFHPPFRRVYYRALSDAANGPLQVSRFAPVLAGNHQAFLANGLGPPFPGGGSNYITARMRYINQELSQVDQPFALTMTSNLVTGVNLLLLEGTAPVRAREIQVNGVPYPVTWLDVGRWQMRVPLGAESNRLEVAAVDTRGLALEGARVIVNVRYTGTLADAKGHIVFNEVMHHPALPGAEFVELHNTSATFTFDLSGWRLSGLDHTFPPGTILEPGGFLLVAREQTPFWEAHGPEPVPDGYFSGNVAKEGETLRLIRPGPTPLEAAIVAELTYSNQPPWPQAASQGGISLQLRDPRQDQNRVGNWAVRLPAAPAEWERVSVTERATSSQLLLYLSGLPPIRDLSTVEGLWSGDINFGGGRAEFRVELRQQGTGWAGDFIFDDGLQEQRFPLSQVAVANGVLTFGFGTEGPAEFRFLFTEGQSMTGRYQPVGEPSYPATLRRLNPGGDVYVDDVWLTQGSIPGTGVNLVVNGDFEAPLPGTWLVGTNHASSTIVTNVQHSGGASLHLAASTGGAGETDAIAQQVAIEPGEIYTLSYWVRRGGNATALVARLGDWSLASVRDLRTVGDKPVASTPGEINSTRAQLPELPLLWLNECQPVNLNGPTDRFGQRSPWVELFNSGTTAISLDGYSLGNSYSTPDAWMFPANATMQPGEFRLVWLDGDATRSTDAEWHASFRPAAGTGTLVLSRRLDQEDQIVDYLDYSNLPDGFSVGWAVAGFAGPGQVFALATPLRPNAEPSPDVALWINEWMALNGQTLADPADGQFDDWFEIYNAGAGPADLGGYTLSDTISQPRRFVIPPGTIIPSGGFLLVWADDQPAQNQPGGDLHVNFKLNGDGEIILLGAPDGTLVDQVSFGPQTRDVAEGRWPDGAAAPYLRLTKPSPGAANVWFREVSLSGVTQTGPNQFEIYWSSTPGQQFRIEYKDNLDDPAWTGLGAPLVAEGLETRVTLETFAADTHRFFRLLLLP